MTSLVFFVLFSAFPSPCPQGPPGGGVLRISSDGDDRRIFLGFEIFDSGIFLGRKIWQVFFWVASFK